MPWWGIVLIVLGSMGLGGLIAVYWLGHEMFKNF